MRIENLTKENTNNLLEKLLKRSPTNYDSYEKDVKAIINNVKDNGDKALFDYTLQFDKANINADNIVVTTEELEEAYKEVRSILRMSIPQMTTLGN